MENTIEERIKNVMSVVFEVPVRQIKDNASPDLIKSWDSLKHMNLVIALEEEFDCEFTDSEAVELLNYQLILVTIKEYTEQN
jgi:acyl carrier protein